MEFSRKTYLDRWIERKHNGLVKILTGIHGCGKSYLLRKLFRDHLIKSGVASDRICVYEFPRSSIVSDRFRILSCLKFKHDDNPLIFLAFSGYTQLLSTHLCKT